MYSNNFFETCIQTKCIETILKPFTYFFYRFYEDESFADIHKVEGMRGVFIASQLINKTLARDHQRSLITFDKGGEWNLVVAPRRDVHNNLTGCSTVSQFSYC